MMSQSAPPIPNGQSTPFQSTGPVSKTPLPASTNEPRGSVAERSIKKREDKPVPEVNQPSDKVGRDELDAKLAATEARSEAKIATLQGDLRAGFAELRGEMRLILERVDSVGRDVRDVKASRQWVIGTVLASALAIIGIIIAVGLGSVGAMMSDRANVLSAIQAAIGLTQKEAPAANNPPTPSTPGAPTPRP